MTADLHRGDCLEILPRLLAARGRLWDHVITDPPYEDLHHAAHANGTIARTDGRAPPRRVAFPGIGAIREEAARVLVAATRGWIVVFCLAEGVRPWHDALTAAGARWHGTGAWIKADAAPMFTGHGPARGLECVALAWAGPGRRRWNGGGSAGIWHHPTAKGGVAAAKPLSLMRALVGLFSQHGEDILDPFMGSGTTGVAALQLGRSFCGIERDPDAFEAARLRIEEAGRQPPLPLPAPPGGQLHLSLA